MLFADIAISGAQAEFGKFWYVCINFVTSHFLKSEIASLKGRACFCQTLLLHIEEKMVCIDWGHKLYFLELECLFCSMGNEWCLTTFKQGIVFLCFSMQRLVVLWTDS